MAIFYLMHKATGKVGVAELPEWINFDEQPPRSFEVCWRDWYGRMRSTTDHVVPIDKAVYDLMESLNNGQ